MSVVCEHWEAQFVQGKVVTDIVADTAVGIVAVQLYFGLFHCPTAMFDCYLGLRADRLSAGREMKLPSFSDRYWHFYTYIDRKIE